MKRVSALSRSSIVSLFRRMLDLVALPLPFQYITTRVLEIHLRWLVLPSVRSISLSCSARVASLVPQQKSSQFSDQRPTSTQELRRN